MNRQRLELRISRWEGAAKEFSRLVLDFVLHGDQARSLSDLNRFIKTDDLVDSLMAASFVRIDRNTPMLLPPDLRDWVSQDDLVHFVIEAC